MICENEVQKMAYLPVDSRTVVVVVVHFALPSLLHFVTESWAKIHLYMRIEMIYHEMALTLTACCGC